jgi:LacI family transcriptional regulator
VPSVPHARVVTIKDVARSAGVSVATVSRVFNARHLVQEETLTRVQQVVERLGYVPHIGARNLVTRRTHTIGVLLPDLYGEFFSEVIRGIDQTAHRQGYHLLVSSAREAGPPFEAALGAMRGRVDGLIVMSPYLDSETFRRTLTHGNPVVLLSCPPGVSGCDTVSIANFEGSRAVTRHLLALGHRRIAMILGAVGNFDAAERLRGYQAAMEEAGMAADPGLLLAGDFSEASGHAAAEQILALPDRPTAVFAANDCMAIGALSAFREAGLTVPGDIAIAGFDDIPMARYVHPALTSVSVEISLLGERATARLLDALRRPVPRETVHDTLSTTLVVRRSCGAERA